MSDTRSSAAECGPRLSIVIPVLNEAADLPALLNCLQAWRDVAELIVADGGSTDDTVAVAGPRVDRVVHAPRGRAIQMNAGAAASTAPYLFFLHSDTTPGIAPDVLAAILDSRPLWGFFRVRLSGRSPVFRLIETCMNWRSRLTSVATGDQCLFLSRAAWQASGGFPVISLMEDVMLSKRLRLLAKPTVIAQPVTTSSRRWEERGIVRTVLLMWMLRLRFWLGSDPVALERRYRA